LYGGGGGDEVGRGNCASQLAARVVTACSFVCRLHCAYRPIIQR